MRPSGEWQLRERSRQLHGTARRRASVSTPEALSRESHEPRRRSLRPADPRAPRRRARRAAGAARQRRTVGPRGYRAQRQTASAPGPDTPNRTDTRRRRHGTPAARDQRLGAPPRAWPVATDEDNERHRLSTLAVATCVRRPAGEKVVIALELCCAGAARKAIVQLDEHVDLGAWQLDRRVRANRLEAIQLDRRAGANRPREVMRNTSARKPQLG